MMENKVNEDILHYYHKCDKCSIEPIWGTRFTCKECPFYDLCESKFLNVYLLKFKLIKK